MWGGGCFRLKRLAANVVTLFTKKDPKWGLTVTEQANEAERQKADNICLQFKDKVNQQQITSLQEQLRQAQQTLESIQLAEQKKPPLEKVIISMMPGLVAVTLRAQLRNSPVDVVSHNTRQDVRQVVRDGVESSGLLTSPNRRKSIRGGLFPVATAVAKYNGGEAGNSLSSPPTLSAASPT